MRAGCNLGSSLRFGTQISTEALTGKMSYKIKVIYQGSSHLQKQSSPLSPKAYFTGCSLSRSETSDDPLLSKNKAEKMPLKKFTFMSSPCFGSELPHSLHILHKNPPEAQNILQQAVSALGHTSAAQTCGVQLGLQPPLALSRNCWDFQRSCTKSPPKAQPANRAGGFRGEVIRSRKTFAEIRTSHVQRSVGFYYDLRGVQILQRCTIGKTASKSNP